MKITVFYDGLCPLCTREVARWQDADFRCQVEWLDLNGQEELLVARGIDPRRALLELHTQTDDGRLHTSIDSYALLLGQLPQWSWLGRLISLPGIRQLLKWIYDWLTRVRLGREGRLPGQCKSGSCRGP